MASILCVLPTNLLGFYHSTRVTVASKQATNNQIKHNPNFSHVLYNTTVANCSGSSRRTTTTINHHPSHQSR